MGVEQTRRYSRVTCPFDAVRISSRIELPVRLYDICEGGCFITSEHEASAVGRPVELKIDMPRVGWLSVSGEVVYARPPFGYAVKFTEMTDETRRRLEQALTRLRTNTGAANL